MGSKEVFQEIVQSILSIYGNQEAEAIAYRILDMEFSIGKLDYLMNKSIDLPTNWADKKVELESGKPFQYVFGKEFFRDLLIGLNDDTLIPRPETEELVQLVLKDLKQASKPVRVLDIGTGSGCIPLAIKNEFPLAEVTGWDLSTKALEQAEINAKNVQLSVNFQLQNVFEWKSTTEKWDIIVSNPPYVLEAEKEEMMPHVLDFEPELALFVPNEDPLKYYHAISEMAFERLNPSGKLFFEINQAFGKEIQDMLMSKGFKEVEVIKDFRGKDRFVRSKK